MTHVCVYIDSRNADLFLAESIKTRHCDMLGCMCKVVAFYSSMCEFWAVLFQGDCLWPCFCVAHYGEPVLALGAFPFPLCLRLCGRSSDPRTCISPFVYRLCRSLSVCKPPLLTLPVGNMSVGQGALTHATAAHHWGGQILFPQGYNTTCTDLLEAERKLLIGASPACAERAIQSVLFSLPNCQAPVTKVSFTLEDCSIRYVALWCMPTEGVGEGVIKHQIK